ncbi:MAG: sulfatase-like hydrolase/transferase [Armatimonadetes bacterium]|nr:sulfatase-like hydrolase/transferase [Armatimonadota bacterium]
MRRPSERPAILILNTDQQRFDTIAAAGNSLMHTPNLDRLSRRGVTLERYYVQNPVCAPSRASVMSGRYPNATGVTCNGIVMPEDIRCIQHMLGDAGYFTGVIGKLHFLPHAGRDHREAHPPYGFDQLQISDEPGCYRDAYWNWVRERGASQLDAINVGLPPARAQWERMMGFQGTVQPPEPRENRPRWFEADDDLTQAAFVADRTCRFLEERAGRPFFLWAGFYSPHSPWIAPKSCAELYDVEAMPLPDRGENEPLSGEAEGLSDDDLRRIKAFYYAMITDVDRAVGRVLDTLEQLGIADHTIVVFTSDHGEFLGDHGRFGKGMPGNDCIMRVPCLISYPGHIPEGETVSEMVEAVDLLPTLLDYAGVVAEPQLQGQSLRGLIEGGDGGRASVFAEHAVPGRQWQVCVRTREWFYSTGTDGRELLYDLTQDPGEHCDVAQQDEYAAALSDMRRLCLQRQMAALQPGPRVAAY